jgi:hypothetical protein
MRDAHVLNSLSTAIIINRQDAKDAKMWGALRQLLLPTPFSSVWGRNAPEWMGGALRQLVFPPHCSCVAAQRTLLGEPSKFKKKA